MRLKGRLHCRDDDFQVLQLLGIMGKRGVAMDSQCCLLMRLPSLHVNDYGWDVVAV